MSDDPLIADAALRQRRAADAGASVWVAASAGTGKTKVLTDRVLTLLLAGNPPQKLLCLTFTKAAAAEMSNRVAGVLAVWATAPDDVLRAKLRDLLGRDPEPKESALARNLFASVLDAPGGMRIETIHAFCQSLLRRFPLEAGLAPHFNVMDDRDAGELMRDSLDDVLTRARAGHDSDLAAALALLTGVVHETKFADLTNALAADRGRLKRFFDRCGGLAGAAAQTRARLELAADDDAETILARACADENFAAEVLRRAVPVMLAGKTSDAKAGALMAEWLAAAAAERPRAFDAYCGAYLTKEGDIRAKLVTNGLRDAEPWLEPAMAAEAERLLRVKDRIRAARTAEATQALMVLGDGLLAAYERRKQARALMDYDDLILAARNLLSRPGIAPWVLFKLDGGIDHVLIDEAQDTNPDQWAVAAALTQEFFAGDGAREQLRTVFAVGDVKQSIYSFQRADPEEFLRMRRDFARHAGDAGREWREIPLNLSFRSTRAVLDAVDAVFAGQGPGRDGVTDDDPQPEHLAFRQGQAGLVELWPPVKPRAADETPAWKPPVERLRGDSPRTRLARLVARRIRAMVGGEMLESQNRPIRAGDVMVLLRRRGGFVEDLVRELKSLGVPVAGADRMVLTEQAAVMDLTALGNFLLLPEDDLTLATVLKSPLLGWSEDDLFRIAWNRAPQSLWEAVKRKAPDEECCARAVSYLTELLNMADRLRPHELFAHVLGPMGGKRALTARLGPDCEDPLDEFMSLTMAFESGHAPSLQGFLRWLETGAVEIKRDLDQAGRDAVRIMTVHGSKGLQAPVVFLPDTMQVPQNSGTLLWSGEADAEVLLWPPAASWADSVCRAAQDSRKLAAEREYRRLLYVAMTRAEDRLYVCGWETRRAPPAGCWYNLIRDGLAPTAQSREDPFLAAAGETEDAIVLRIACPQTVPVKAGETAPAPQADMVVEAPSWAHNAPEPEPAPPRPLAPSRPEGEEPPARSPLSGGDGAARFKRGKLIHRLLQILPQIPRDKRAQSALRFLKGQGIENVGEALAMVNEVADILDHPQFAALFGPDSRAEAPLVGLIGDDRAVSGQVDRLAVSETEVLVADFKTNRRPPDDPADIPPIYVKQMAAYSMALACIYPHKRIRCVLVWTDGPKMMEIPAAALKAAL